MRLPTCSQHSRLAFSRIFNATATTVIYTLSLHDALPISALQLGGGVVKVHDDILCTFTSLEGAANQVLTRLNQNLDRKSTRLNSSHVAISYAVFCLKKKKMHKLNRIKIIDKLKII